MVTSYDSTFTGHRITAPTTVNNQQTRLTETSCCQAAASVSQKCTQDCETTSVNKTSTVENSTKTKRKLDCEPGNNEKPAVKSPKTSLNASHDKEKQPETKKKTIPKKSKKQRDAEKTAELMKQLKPLTVKIIRCDLEVMAIESQKRQANKCPRCGCKFKRNADKEMICQRPSCRKAAEQMNQTKCSDKSQTVSGECYGKILLNESVLILKYSTLALIIKKSGRSYRLQLRPLKLKLKF